MDRLLQDAGARAQKVAGLIEYGGREIYGTPSDGVLESMKKFLGPGVAVSFSPQWIGGFVRKRA
jgi:hypothetical protein